MKALSTHGMIWLTLVLFISYGCAASEEISEETQPTHTEMPDPIEEPVSPAPGWYHSGISSSADSLSLYGFAHTVSAGLEDAKDQARATAEKNLRFEVDRQLEQARTDLEAEGYEMAGDPAFIIQLRNFAANIPLGQPLDIEIEHISNDGNLNEIYARYVLTRSELYAELEKQLTDQKLLEKIKSSG